MKSHQHEDNVPEQEIGAKSDIEHSVKTKDRESAKDLFELAKGRLLDVNQWHEISGSISGVFKLTDDQGNQVNRKARQGDHFQINLPAPGSEAGEGYDWVCVEAIEDHSDPAAETEILAMRVRPSRNLLKRSDDVAHFFEDTATSSFTVERQGNQVTASVHGRNEIPNTKTEGIIDKARNAVVALGAMIGLSTPQWKGLVKGLLDHEDSRT